MVRRRRPQQRLDGHRLGLWEITRTYTHSLFGIRHSASFVLDLVHLSIISGKDRGFTRLADTVARGLWAMIVHIREARRRI